MTLDIQQVQPGDLVTASFFNALVGALASLDARVTALELNPPGAPAGAVLITAVSPQPARVGQDLTIVGENFGFSIGAHRVRFNNVQPAIFRPGSGDSVLICQVPDLPGLQESGTPVTLTVSNATSAASRVITLLPAQLQQAGNVDTVFEGASPDPLTAGADNDFEFRLSSDALLPATLVLTPSVKTAAGATLSWAATVLDAAKAPVAGGILTLAPSEEKTVFIRVAVPGGTNATPFRLELAAAGGGIESSSGALDLTVGQNADPDTDIMLSPSAAPGLEGATISAPPNTIRTLSVECDLSAAGTYDVSLTPLAGLTNWTRALLAPPANAPQIVVDPDDLLADGVADRSVQLRVRPDAGATDGQLRLTVQRTGSSKSRSFTFDMNVT